MKNKLSFLFALVAMLMMSGQTWAEVTMTFSYVNSKNEIIVDAMSYYNTPLSVYSLGEKVAKTDAIWNKDDYGYNTDFTGKWSMTFDDALAGKTVSYETNFGHKGTFTVTEGGELKAQLVTLTVTVKDTEGQPVSDTYVVIYTPNGNSSGYYTNNDGQIVKYYPASTGYSWSWGEQNGTFDLTADYELNITKQAATTFNLQVKSRYGDYPLGNRSFYLYKYGDKKNEVASFYGSGSTKVDAGDYWVKDELGVFGDKFTVSGDMTYWVDYKKVTFKSMTGTTPNTNQEIRVYYDTDSYNYNNVRTNSNGEATVYLQAADYQYYCLGKYTEFTMGTTDQTVNISTSSVTITLDCTATTEELGEQSFRWINGNSTTYAEVKDGKIVVSPLWPGDYQLSVNGMGTVDVPVALGENNKSVKLYALQFTTNIETTNNVYLFNADNKRLEMNYGKKYYLLSGDYSYSQSYYGNPMGTVSLTQNTDVPLNYGILTVTVKDSKGVVAGQQVSFGGYSRETDENGQVTFTELVGDEKFTLSARDCYVEKEITLVAGEQTTTLTIPDFVTFNMLHMGQPMNTDNVWLNAVENTNVSYRAQVVNGVAKARLDPTLTYTLNAYHGATAITEGSTVSLGQLNVTCDGMGIALPMENWDAISSYFVLVGTTVRLAAIPVGGSAFQKWDVNGTEYAEGMMDLKITAPITTAKAVFGETVPTKVKQFETNTTFNSDGRFVYLPENVKGTVSIYAFDGKLMKNLGVSGDQIGIYDLPTGAYIITLKTDDGDTKVARFMK